LENAHIMGSTITEKILAKAAGRKEVSPGDYVEVTSRCPTPMGNFGGLRGGLEFCVEWEVGVFNPKLIRIVDGHLGATASHNAARSRMGARKWAKSVGIPNENIYTLGRSGIENMFSAERAWALPGEVYLQAVNGHSSGSGALGAFATTLSYGRGEYFMTGKTWMRVPRTIKIVVNGTLPAGTCARDLFEYLLSQIGPTGAGGAALEWTGPVVEALSMGERFSLCSLAIFTGAWTAIINPDEKTLAYVRERTDESFEPQLSDPDARFAKILEIDVTNLEPQVVPPPKRHLVQPLKELEGTPINRGFIGSDAGSWIEHLRMAAHILKGRKINPRVVLNITPGTTRILRQALDEGLIGTFIDAECVVPTPNEGMEWGANTPLSADEVCIASGQTNYPGRMGSDEAQIYLANPMTVAASCLEGKIADPRKYFQ
jgi:3-isopropylmalate/(R)-2-methylmalate dehydratase large subunit